MRKIILMFVAVSTLFVGCKKEDVKKEEKKEEIGISISVSDFDNSTINSFPKLEGVEVKLYKTLEDAINEKNMVLKKVTDSQGECIFTGLEEIEYYVAADGENCLSNMIDLIKGEDKVKAEKVEIDTYSSPNFPYKPIFVSKVAGVVVVNRLDKSIEVSLGYGGKKFLKGKTDKHTDETLFIIRTEREKKSYNKGNIKIKIFETNSTTPFKTIELNVNNLDCSQPKRIYIEP